MVNTRKHKPAGAGHSSFSLVDPGKVFGELTLKSGSIFLDVACGRGEYAIAASSNVGGKGLVYAINLWEEGIAALSKKALAMGIRNLKTLVGDVSKGIPIEDATVDVCLMATVLHDLVQEGVADGALKEAARVLKARSLLAVIEFKNVEGAHLDLPSISG